jgi:hypothetical protein
MYLPRPGVEMRAPGPAAEMSQLLAVPHNFILGAQGMGAHAGEGSSTPLLALSYAYVTPI